MEQFRKDETGVYVNTAHIESIEVRGKYAYALMSSGHERRFRKEKLDPLIEAASDADDVDINIEVSKD